MMLFLEIACEISDVTENSPLERLQSGTLKKIRGPERVV